MQAVESETFALSAVNRPLVFRRAHFMVLRFYVDESYREGRAFTIAGVFSTGLIWAKFESKWNRLLGKFNKDLLRKGRCPISRFHSADLSSLRGEFAGWDPQMRTDFMRLMLSSFRGYAKPYHFGILAYYIDLRTLFNVFPEFAADGEAWRRACYFLTVKTLLSDFVVFLEKEKRARLGERADSATKSVTAQLIFDRCRCSGAIRAGCEAALADRMCREMFVGITESSWETAIPLQAADLAAYEVFKEADRLRSGSDRAMRLSLRAMGTMSEFAGHVGELDEEQLRAFRREAEANGQPIFSSASFAGV